MKLLLHQIVAVVVGAKNKWVSASTAAHRGNQQERTDGLIRTYTPYDAEDRDIPSDDASKGIAVDSSEVLKQFGSDFAKIVDIVASQDVGNASAKANVEVDGAILLKDVPVTHLIWLEKQLVDVRTFFEGLPVLDPMKTWTYDANRECYITAPTTTTRSVKAQRFISVAKATDKHPEQIQAVTESNAVGYYSTVYISKAVPGPTKKEYLRRIDELITATKQARAKANMVEVDLVNYGTSIMGYLLKPVE